MLVYERRRLPGASEKVGTGKPVETQPDHLAARVTAETPEARGSVAAALAPHTVKREDHSQDAGGPNGFRADTHQVKVSNDPHAALKTAEVQIVSPEQHSTAEDTHEMYKKQRAAAAAGDHKTAFRLAHQLRQANGAAAKDSAASQAWPKGTRVLVQVNGAQQAGSIVHWNPGVNGAPRRARVLLDTGRNLDSVKESQLMRASQ